MIVFSIADYVIVILLFVNVTSFGYYVMMTSYDLKARRSNQN